MNIIHSSKILISIKTHVVNGSQQNAIQEKNVWDFHGLW